ncbi:MAG: NTP transferase domain-containing protein [candidate division Zixibacteria bacterium]|nr:NTP transferase domain-containing protein [candidate division Zixibacteria bacterium]
MKGVILAGGEGVRLRPFTENINKHLLEIGEHPMIHSPLSVLCEAGISEVLIVTGERWIDDFKRKIGEPTQWGLRSISYVAQSESAGIVNALSMAEQFAGDENLIVMLGDNLIEKPPYEAIKAFSQNPQGAKVVLKEISNPREFGVATLKCGQITDIVEKPDEPESDLAVIGLYLYDSTVFKRIRAVEPSARGEYEITDLNKSFLEDERLGWVELSGWWMDCGSTDNLAEARKFADSGKLRLKKTSETV